MSAGRLLSMIGMAVALSAAGAPDFAHAQVVRGNDTGGIIPWSCENEADAMALAGSYCAWWRKYPRITSVDRQPGNYIAFNCLWDPRIGGFQLPAARLRSSCYVPARHHALPLK